MPQQHKQECLYVIIKYSIFIFKPPPMDTRSDSGFSPIYSVTSQSQQTGEIISQAIYFLSRKYSLYNEFTNTLIRDREIQSTSKMIQSAITGYTSKPYIYAIFAGVYHLIRKRVRVLELCFHATMYAFITQYDMNQLVKQRENTKQSWEEYQQANKNYNRAIKMLNFSLLKYVGDFIESKVEVRDFEQILRNRPL